jgi:tetratricopeptide (TPR) repeat protein
MNPVLREYLAKGIFLGLWAYLAIIQPEASAFTHVIFWGLGGLALGLVAGLVLQLKRGYKPGANIPGFLLMVMLDSPYFIYAGLIGGFGLGTFLETDAPEGRNWLGYAVAGGAVLGLGFYQLRLITDWFYRFLAGLVVGGLVTYLAITYLGQIPALDGAAPQRQFAIYLLLGLPFFYLLTICGEAEESEVEIAALCATLGIGLYLLRLESKLPEHFDKLIFLVPLGLYFVYSTKWLPALKTFKHNLRGYGYMSLGHAKAALASFNRALQLDPKNDLATQGVRRLMTNLDPAKIDAATAQLLPIEFCLANVANTLINSTPPTDKERDDALKMLDILGQQRPALMPRLDYYRAIGLTHAKEFDAAATALSTILDPANENPARQVVLFDAWNLATRLHPELTARLGTTELARPGRRLDAIAAVEQRLAKQPEDPTAIEMKRELYASLEEAEFLAASETPSATRFNYDYIEQLGQTLIQHADTPERERGMAYLRMAGRGSLARGPVIFQQLAETAQQMGRSDEAVGYYGQIKRTANVAGVNQLTPETKSIYLKALRQLVDDAEKKQQFGTAVEDMRLIVEAGQEDPNTLRKLAELYVKNGDALNALLIVERGLLYAKTDADLLAKKDSYYFSVELSRVQEVKDKISGWFDVPYLLKKANQVADQKDADLDTLEYGLHLIRLARIMQPKSHAIMFAEARLLLRKTERDAGLAILEDIREQPRASGDEEDAWFLAVRMLGDIYLEELNRPDLAIDCYNAFRDYQKSGADTLFKLGRAHEANHNIPAAIKAYEALSMYPKHPRFYEAQEAVTRLRG